MLHTKPDLLKKGDIVVEGLAGFGHDFRSPATGDGGYGGEQ